MTKTTYARQWPDRWPKLVLVLVHCALSADFWGTSLFSSYSVFGFSSPSSSSPTRLSDARLGDGDIDEDVLAGKIVQEHLGYLPSNFVRVSAWTKRSRTPIAIQTYPLQGGAKRRQAKAVHGDSPTLQSPFPTLYWLTCPKIGRCIADLERRGFLQEFESRVHSDPELVAQLGRCHRQYANERWLALSPTDRQILSDATEPAVVRMRGIMQDSGISGSNLTLTIDGDDVLRTPSIKCLHAHYAHFRSTKDRSGYEQNPVGEMIHRQLMQEYPDLEL